MTADAVALPGSGESHAHGAATPEAPSDLPRWLDTQVEVPTLRAQLRRAEQSRDVERERLLAATLARSLLKRQSELGLAVRLARRAVLLGDEGLRPELAAWHCQLGQIALAVGMLLPLLESPGLDRSRLLMRVALYWARLGAADEALASLREAAAYSPGDPLIHELSAMIHGWAPRATSAIEAADAYLKGARCREQRDDTELAFEDLLRAFDTAPQHIPAAEALARAFALRAHPRVADEVWRRHADALGAAGVEVHRARLRSALGAGNLEAALAAALDARLDASVDGHLLIAVIEEELPAPEPGQEFDWLLVKLGLSELLAARLELAAEAAHGSLASRCRVALGRYADRVLGGTERAVEQWLDAVVADPENEAAKFALRHYASSTGDHSALMEALIRVAQDERASVGQRLGSLFELKLYAEQRSGDTGLAYWCVRRILELGPGSEELAAAERALASRAAEEAAALEPLEVLRSASAGSERTPVLRRMVAILKGLPERAERYRELLWQLVEQRPEELRARRELERLLTRQGNGAELAQLWTRDLATATDPNLTLRALLGLSRLERARGNLQGALAVLAASGEPGLVAAACMQMSLAAQLGNRRLRADGLLRLLGGVSAQGRALCASVASAELLAIGEQAAALAAAEVAAHADPSLARPLVAFANAATGKSDRVAAVAYERAMALSLPNSAHCQALVRVLDALGDAHACERWTARWLGLRPADTAAALQLLAVATRERDAARLGDVISWAVSQAHPLKAWENELALALDGLAELDPARAGQMAWRMLDSFGPEPPALRRAVLDAAQKAGDKELAVAALERELGASEPAEPRLDLLWELVRLHRTRGEVDRAYSVLARALQAGAALGEVSSMLELLGRTESPEGDFYRLQVVAELSERTEPTPPHAARALREYGAALWDLAKDRDQAIATWLRAAELEEGGWQRLARDLGEVMGLTRALDEVGRIAETLERPEQAAALLTGAGLVALERGQRRQALQLGLLALDSEPASPRALALVEDCAGPGDTPSLEHAYAATLGAALGRFGERALHYRAARFLEQRKEQRAALAHAIEAFRAVPSEGGAFIMLQRLIETGEEAVRAAQVVEEVARRSSAGRQRAEWLRRAALIIGRSEDGAQQRVELLLRALLDYPDPDIVDLLGRAFTDLSRQKTDGRQLGLLRFERVVAQLLTQLEPMDGSRVAVALASVALSCFGDAALALKALASAARLDPEADDFAELVPDAARLAEAGDGVRSWLEEIHEAIGEQHRASLSLLDLAAEVAAAAGLHGVAARFLTLKSQRLPEDEKLRARAELAVGQSRETDLPDYVLRAFPAQARRSELLGRAELCASKGDRGGELAALREALSGPLPLPRDVLVRLVKLAGSAHEFELAEQALKVVIGSDIDPEALVQLARGLAALMLEQRAPQRALRLLEDIIKLAPEDSVLLTQALAAARASADDQARRHLLSRLIDLTSDPIKKRLWYSEAWEVAKKAGDSAAQTDILRRWLTSDPEDTTPLVRLEAECEAREAWPELCELLQQHLALPLSTDERRRLGLKLSYLLEGKLGRLEQARSELVGLCEQLRGDLEVVERLAHVSQQLGDHAAAASLWLSASALQVTRAGAAEFAARAGRMFLDSGDFMSARRVLAAPQAFPRTLELLTLAVRLEREGGNLPRLARALEELGGAEEQGAMVRAAALLEAAGLWHHLNEIGRAARCAAQAAACVPHDPIAQLTLSELEYRMRGAGTREDAQRTLERLRGVGSHWSSDQRNLAGFLLAEALELVEGPEAALAELYEHERFGPLSLVSAAIAERLANGGEPRRALAHFELALKGELHELFRPSRLALSAARAALRAELPERALQFLTLAEPDPELQAQVARLREQLAQGRSQSTEAFAAVRPPESVQPASEPARASGDGTHDQRSWGRTTRIGLGDVPRAPAPAEPARAAPPTPAPPRATPASVAPAAAAANDPQWNQLAAPFRPKRGREEELFRAFVRRSAEAGSELLALLEREPARAHDAVVVARMLVWLVPGEAEPLEQLKRAAEADQDAVYSAALAQLLDAAVRGERPQVPAPALERQVEQPQNLRALLFGDLVNPSTEALGIVWQSAGRVLAAHWEEELGSADAVRDDGSALVSDFFQLSRLFGTKRTPLLRLRGTRGKLTVRPLLAAQPALVVAGDEAPDPSELRHDLGAALAGTLPPSVLMSSGNTEREAELFQAIQAAFGPPSASGATFVSGARLAELLWESVPPRAQRSLAELCAREALSREAASLAAERATARAGLFAAGDLLVALSRLPGNLAGAELHEPGGLARACRESAAAVDLVRLATSPQYAEARFRSDRGRRGAGFTRRVR